MAPKHIAGVMGTFGDVMRPDGKTQVTYNGQPLYTVPRRHADEDPLQRRRRLVRRQGALVTMEPRETRLYGRRAFLGVTAVGLSSLSGDARPGRRVSGATQPFVDALPSGLIPSGWRIYTVAASMPRFDPQTWRLRIDGLVEQPQSRSTTSSCARCRGPSRSRRSTA